MPDGEQMLSVTGSDMAIIPEREEQLLPLPAAKCSVTQRSSFFQKNIANQAIAYDTEVRIDVTWMSLCTFGRYSYTADILIGLDHMFDLMRDVLKHCPLSEADACPLFEVTNDRWIRLHSPSSFTPNWL